MAGHVDDEDAVGRSVVELVGLARLDGVCEGSADPAAVDGVGACGGRGGGDDARLLAVGRAQEEEGAVVRRHGGNGC